MAKDEFDDQLDEELKALAAEVDKPKAKASTKAKKEKPKQITPIRPSPIEKRVLAMGAGVELAVRTIGNDETCGDAIGNGMPNLARSLDNLARQNPKVKRALEATLSGGAYVEVLVSTIAILIPVLAHHKMLPGGERMGDVIGAAGAFAADEEVWAGNRATGDGSAGDKAPTDSAEKLD